MRKNMYMFIGNKEIIPNKGIASGCIGIAFPTLSKILNKRVACSKMTAYCITKYIDENAEINDFFERVN